MEEKSRTEHSVQNTTTAIIAKMIALLTGFITRVVFTHCLSQTYVGINGLFWDILNVFSLSEFGVGTAITYALYEPVAKGDVEKQKSLMQLYRKIYHIMGGFVLAAGLAVIPFMDFLVKGYESVDHLIAIYLLYLANSVFSYLLIYKKSMLDAHQLSYLGEYQYDGFYSRTGCIADHGSVDNPKFLPVFVHDVTGNNWQQYMDFLQSGPFVSVFKR